MKDYIVKHISFLYHWIRYVVGGTWKKIQYIFVDGHDLLYWYRSGPLNIFEASFALSMSLLFLPFVYLIGYYQDTLNGVIWGATEPPAHGDFQRRVWSGMWVTIALLIYFLFWTAIPSLLLTFIGPTIGTTAFVLSLVLMLYFFPALWVVYNHSEKFREEEAITVNRILWNRTYITEIPKIFTAMAFGFALSAVAMIFLSTVFVVTPLTLTQTRYLIVVLAIPVSHIATIQVLYAVGRVTRKTLLKERGSYYSNDTQPEWMDE